MTLLKNITEIVSEKNNGVVKFIRVYSPHLKVGVQTSPPPQTHLVSLEKTLEDKFIKDFRA